MLSAEGRKNSWQLRSADWLFVWGVCCRLPTADFFLVLGGLEAGQEVAGFWGLGLEVGFYVVDVDCGGWVAGGAPGGDANHEVVRKVADQDSGNLFKFLGPGDVFLKFSVVDSSGYSPVDYIFDHTSIATFECDDIELLASYH